MSRIKWNLDQLEEVKRQHDEYMESTEEVINKGRSDLASMTEKVWEGEDADMAREQYDHLVYREMPDTWRQLDTCNESIQRALKQAYEAKNFCNDFPQIFKSGSMPSEIDSSSCSGYFMCDEGNCNQLMSYMDAAGREAAELKRNIESVESILSSLETDEAKFDYASYTEPIKEQSQNVADYTRTYNIALGRYVQKVDDLDRTLENKLLNATPLSVSQPFDPACIEFGEYIHFRNGDIVNSLEDHNHADISYSFEVSEIERILEMLFDKKNLDISGLSEKDFEIAFLKLSKEKQRAMLHDMGLSNAQIDSILATEQSRRAFANTVFKSGAMDKIRKMDSKMPQYNNFGKPKDKTGGSKEKAPIPSAQSSSGVVECDNSLSYTTARLMPEYYDVYANSLIEAADKLCDDDPSNDEEAMAYISEFLEKGFYVEERNNQTYLMYDVEFLDYCKGKAGEGSLLYEWLEDLDDFFCEDGTYCSFNGDGPFPTCSFEMSKLGAGYQLNLSIDFKDDDIQNINEKVAYATTKELAERYFIKDGVLDYATLEEWFKLEGIDEDSIEFAVLAKEMIEHQGDNVFYILEMGEYRTKDLFFMPDAYKVSDQLKVLAMYYQIEAQLLQVAEGGYEGDCTRAAAFRAITEFMCTQGNGPHNIEITNEKDSNGRTKYNVNIKYNKAESASIEIYPYGDFTYVDETLKNETKEVINSFYNDLLKKDLQFAFNEILSVLELSSLPLDAQLFWNDMVNASTQNANIENGVEMLDAGSAARAMGMGGSVVTFDQGGTKYAYVGVPYFDNVTLLMNVEAYNRDHNFEEPYTVDKMKEEYFKQSDEFKAYLEWFYYESGDTKSTCLLAEVLKDLDKNYSELQAMDFKELEETVQGE